MDLKPTFSIVTLGCKVNQYDSWQLARQLKEKGLRQVPFGVAADVVIVNSCTVTHVAEAKARKMLSRARRSSPQGLVVFTGCTAEILLQRGIRLEQADLMVGNADKAFLADRIIELVQGRKQLSERKEKLSLPYFQPFQDEQDDGVHERVRAFLKVQEGCDKFCTFCIIPFTRGMPRSKPIEQVVDEAKELVNDFGFPEIVLTGVCLTLWGREFGLTLADLLEHLHQVEGLKRIRLSSLDPRDIEERLMKTCANLPKVCHHFHISLQSGDDKILEKMGRGHDCHYFQKVVDAFREAMPDAAFTTDIMVGFPGETDYHFENTVKFVNEIGFSRLHVFKYSPRPGTKASELSGHVPHEVAETRAQRLIEVGKELWRKYALKFIGTEQEVLVERCSPTSENGVGFIASGLTSNYLKVLWKSDKPIEAGEILKVQIVEIDEVQSHLVGKTEVSSFEVCGKIEMPKMTSFSLAPAVAEKEG
ncbi:MAG: tRNA (N(6)-L-threonylcarbamoyladenosine(37)-C(2))-methylthiotransferase MtaB [Armatimonadetes bacterium]|nr:tRNA (N(6)-L-threonylcarbamoyladenosine(37)-C(2))-methylthiotransferase MtaB [Armatimonadota bacterium]